MTSSHPWRPALSTEEAIKELRRGAGTQFDPKVVEAFVTAVEKQGHPA
jgi:HD-GYP domain-containing protein (c-di-GMP phosphodiesterase class II)